MKDALRYYLIKIKLLWWLSRLITPNSEAVLAMDGGAWDNSMRRIVLEQLASDVLSEVRDDYQNNDL